MLNIAAAQTACSDNYRKAGHPLFLIFFGTSRSFREFLFVARKKKGAKSTLVNFQLKKFFLTMANIHRNFLKSN